MARDGEEALRKALELPPDLITLDLEMPRMDGFTFLRLLMAQRPTPVMVVSGAQRRGGRVQGARARRGRLRREADAARRRPSWRTIEERADPQGARDAPAAHRQGARPHRAGAGSRARCGRARGAAPRVVAIGSSTGGPAALLQIFGALRRAAAVRVRGRAAHARGLHARLRRAPRPPDAVPRARGRGRRGARAGHRCWSRRAARTSSSRTRGGRVVTRRRARARRATSTRPRSTASSSRRPSTSAQDLLAVVLTGMGDDGRAGVRAVKRGRAARVIAESEETAVIFGMPQQAIRTGAVDAVLPLPEIAPAIQAGSRAQREPRAVRGAMSHDDAGLRGAEEFLAALPQGRGVHAGAARRRTSGCAASSSQVEDRQTLGRRRATASGRSCAASCSTGSRRSRRSSRTCSSGCT